MGQRLTAEDFNNLVQYFTSTAFRLEVQPTYAVSDEQESLAEFLAGKPRPVTEFAFYARWLDRIKTATAQGRRVERVRVLAEPPTDYQRWEMWSGQYNIAAGETLRYLTRGHAVRIGLPIADDWWLFDSSHLALMRFGGHGEPLGGEIISDRAVVSRHRRWWDVAVEHSTLASPSLATSTPTDVQRNRRDVTSSEID